ncbi:MAG: GntR family transcriptional regulator [Chloroflexota bacterium]|nr:GntR family transcriptional regulator [Chloroflexota bacterium]
MNKLEHATLYERVYWRIRALIIEGAFAAGARLDEQSLAMELGVSRTPIREAIGKLTTEGLVEYRPYQGNFVRAFNAKQVNDLYEVRKSLESLAVRLAVSRITDAQIDEVDAILGDVQRAREAGDMAAYGAADRRFHRAIAAFSENETLGESLDRLDLQIQVVRAVANHDPGVVARTAAERPRILAALRARDATGAALLMEEHIEDVRRSVVEQIAASERRGVQESVA